MTSQGETIGFICFGGNRDEDLDNSYGEIWGIYLLPSFQGRGLGRNFWIGESTNCKRKVSAMPPCGCSRATRRPGGFTKKRDLSATER